jgi:putative methionine-R-sulfoxide reductase with GAF domain
VRGRLDSVRRIVDAEAEADDVLRAVVTAVASAPGTSWAGIAFFEDGTLRLGPSDGEADAERRTRIPISYDEGAVGELWVDGEVERDELEQIAALIAPYVLIGWDTGGEAWEP